MLRNEMIRFKSAAVPALEIYLNVFSKEYLKALAFAKKHPKSLHGLLAAYNEENINFSLQLVQDIQRIYQDIKSSDSAVALENLYRELISTLMIRMVDHLVKYIPAYIALSYELKNIPPEHLQGYRQTLSHILATRYENPELDYQAVLSIVIDEPQLGMPLIVKLGDTKFHDISRAIQKDFIGKINSWKIEHSYHVSSAPSAMFSKTSNQQNNTPVLDHSNAEEREERGLTRR
jgi:hypothetical protein